MPLCEPYTPPLSYIPLPHKPGGVSVADPDPGFGGFLTPGSGIRNRFFPDPGSHIFESLVTILLGKNIYIFLKIGPNFFLQHFKNKINLNLVKFVATKKV